MKNLYTLIILLLSSSILLVSSQPISRQKQNLHAGFSVGAKISAEAGVYNTVQRPLPIMASPYVRSYPAVAPYPVVRPMVVPQAVAVPITRPYATVPVVTGQAVSGVVGGYYPYYYPYPYAGYGGAGLRL